MPSLCAGAASSWRSVLTVRSVRATTFAGSCHPNSTVLSKASHRGLPADLFKPSARSFVDKAQIFRCAFGIEQSFRAGLLTCVSSAEGQREKRFLGGAQLPDRLIRRGSTVKDFASRTGALRERRYTTAMPTDAQIKAEALSIIGQSERRPSLVVFDLDYTIWPFWCEVKTTRSEPRLYPEIRGIFEALAEARVPMAIASRTPSPNIATVFLKKLQLTSIFVQKEIYPTFTHKTEHFKALLKGTNVPYEEMLFFDDEDRNVDTISPLGVKCVLVEDGVNINALREGFAMFQPSRSKEGAK